MTVQNTPELLARHAFRDRSKAETSLELPARHATSFLVKVCER